MTDPTESRPLSGGFWDYMTHWVFDAPASELTGEALRLHPPDQDDGPQWELFSVTPVVVPEKGDQLLFTYCVWRRWEVACRST